MIFNLCLCDTGFIFMSIWVLERGSMNKAVLSNKQAVVAELTEKLKKLTNR